MSELEKMNEAMYERLGEIVFKACDARTQCNDERICEQEKNLRLLAAITEIRQMSEFYKPENPTDAEIHEAATEEPVGCPSLAPANLPSGADGTPTAEDREAQSARDREIAYKARAIKWQKFETKKDICVMGRTKQNGKVYEIRIEKRENPDEETTFYCSVNGTEVMHGDFLGGAHMVKYMLEKAMQALVNRKAKRNRQARRRMAKREAMDKSGEVK